MVHLKAVLVVIATLFGLHTLFSFFSDEIPDIKSDSYTPAVVNDKKVEHAEAPAQKEIPLSNVPPPKQQAGDPFAHIEVDVGYADKLPHTKLLHHSDGWTVFRDAYLSNGTLFVVTPDRVGWPERKMMTSTGLPGYNTPENIAARMPTHQELSYITPQEAERLWGRPHVRDGGRNKVWTITGNTIIFNDPIQFLDHYYHYVAELWLGTWAAWRGTFPTTDFSRPRTLPHRAFLPHVENDEWHDKPGFNGYFQRALFPSFTLENRRGWLDRSNATRDHIRAYHLPHVLLVDRSAGFRGNIVGEVHRTAAAAWYPLARQGKLRADWWEPARRAVLEFAGVSNSIINTARFDQGEVPIVADDMRLTPGLEAGNKRLISEGKWHAADWEARMEQEAAERKKVNLAAKSVDDAPIVVTYISRQKSRRRLREPDASELETALQKICARRGWELNIALAEKMSIDEQFTLVARSTILLGVHGNGLSHLIWMPPRPQSTVIEIFYPEGFAHDYEWTARSLGHRHFGVWNNTHFTWPNTPWVAYPDGFQGTEIPVHAQTVADLIEQRLDGKL